MASVASLTRLAAMSLRSLLEGHSNSRIAEGLRSASETLQVLRGMAMQLEQDWSRGHLVDVPEHEICEYEVLPPVRQYHDLYFKRQKHVQSHKQYGQH